MDVGAVIAVLTDGVEGALFVAGAVLAAFVSVHSLKFILKAATSAKWGKK